MAPTGEADRLAPLLFGREGVSLTNIKFFRGFREEMSEEDLREQVHAALTQRNLGLASILNVFIEDVPSRPWRDLASRY